MNCGVQIQLGGGGGQQNGIVFRRGEVAGGFE